MPMGRNCWYALQPCLGVRLRPFSLPISAWMLLAALSSFPLEWLFVTTGKITVPTGITSVGFVYAIMVRSHERECGMVVLPCPNTECTSTIERCGLKRHLEDCIHTEVPCKYRHIGCGVVMKRGDMPAHEAKSELSMKFISLINY